MAENSRMAATVRAIGLDMEPACIAFCPEAPEYFVIGAWHLVENKPGTSNTGADEPHDDASDAPQTSEKQKHEGSIDVYHLAGDEITKIKSEAHPTCAIWDLEFQQHEGRKDIFAAGTSAGTVLVYRVAVHDLPENPLRQLSRIGPISTEGEVMVTKCCWHPTVPDLLAFSTLAGEVHLARLDRAGGFTVAAMTRIPVLAHTEPAWTVALGPLVGGGGGETGAAEALTVYSGGDDSALRYVTRACVKEQGPPDDGFPVEEGGCEAVAMLRGPHEAGVVSILPLAITLSSGSNVVVTGSYDDRVRVLAVRPPELTYGVAQYKVLGEADVGGGAWRLRLVSVAASSQHEGGKLWKIRLLAPCMSAGSRTLEIRGADGQGEWEVEVVGSWMEEAEGDKMLNYGADWQPRRPGGIGGDEPLTCVSTSFYSKTLYLWRA